MLVVIVDVLLFGITFRVVVVVVVVVGVVVIFVVGGFVVGKTIDLSTHVIVKSSSW